MHVLAVGAHPDDIEFECAGTLAKYKRMGHTVALAVATNGEVGSPTLDKQAIADVRRREAEASAAILDAACYWLGYPDEFLFNTPETRLAFIEMIRQARPDLILVNHPRRDYHPDHTTTGQIIWDTHVMVTVPNIKTASPPCERIPNILYMDTLGMLGLEPNRYVNIDRDIETKKGMLSCHASQNEWSFRMYGVSLVDMMISQSRARGFQCGCTYAEAFEEPTIWPRTVPPDGLL